MPTHTGRVFEIYSIGDGLFMRRVIDSIAAMSNAGLFIKLVALSLMIGLLVMGFKSIMSGGQKMDLASTFVGILLGMIMFGMKADVVIHDMNYAPGEYTVNSYPVANVPFGVAAAGYIISGVSYNLTLKMEQGFGLYSASRSTLIEGGFGNTLEWINSIRAWREPALDSMQSNVAGTDQDLSIFRQNLGQYMNRCVIPGIHMGHKHLPTMMRAGDVFSNRGIKYEHNMLMTDYVSNTSLPPEVLSCTNAYARLDAAKDAIPQNFAKGIAMASGRNAYSTDGKSAQERMDEAYNAIGVSSSEMQKLIVSEVVGMSLQNAILGDDKFNSLDKSTRIMVEQAAAQRAVQWAAEETMFRRIMRPMMAFFEALLYALAPFMALLIGFGSYGLQLIGKYMMISIWVSLWLPMLSIIELFQVTMAQHAIRGMRTGLDGISGNPADFTSIAGAHNLSSQAVEWLGTGAAMAAMTPALTLMLVWGGSVTASALAGRMQGSDTINEKVAAPDVANTSSAIQSAPLANHNNFSGTRTGGSDSAVPLLQTQAAISNAVAIKESQMQAASQNFANRLSQTMTDTASRTHSRSNTQSINDTGSLMVGNWGRTEGGQSANTGVNEGVSQSIDKGKRNTDTSSVSLGTSGGANARGANDVNTKTGGAGGQAGGGSTQRVKGGGVAGLVSQVFGGNMSNEVATNLGTSEGYNRNTGGGNAEHAGHSSGKVFNDARQYAESIGLTSQQASAFAQTVSNNKELSEAFTSMRQASTAYEKTRALQESAGVSQSIPIDAAARQVLEKGMGGAASAAASALLSQEDVSKQRARLPMILGQEKETAAQLLALNAAAQKGNAAASSALADILSGTMGKTTMGGIAPRNPIDAPIPNSEAIEKSVGNLPGSTIQNSSAFYASVQRQASSIVGANPSGFGEGLRIEEARDPQSASERHGQPAVDSINERNTISVADSFGAVHGGSRVDDNLALRIANEQRRQNWEAQYMLGAFKSEENGYGLAEVNSVTSKADQILKEMPHILPKGQEGVAALAIAAFEHGNQGQISNLLTAEKMRAVLDFADTDIGKAVINAYTGPEGGMNMRKADLDIRSGNGNQYFHEDGSTVMRNSSDLTRRY